MCGIIARISNEGFPDKTLNALKELEYRGYDSFGILLYNVEDKKFTLLKKTGEFDEKYIENLRKVKSNVELGHTRWATHGKVNEANAHPHFDEKKEFYVVMNGIIENYSEVKKFLEENGVKFHSESDTEIIPQLFAYYLKNEKKITIKDLVETSKRVKDTLEGEYSYVLKHNGYLLAFKNTNPIIIGLNPNEAVICSDMGIIQNCCKDYVIMEDFETFSANFKGGKVEMKFYDESYKQIRKSLTKSIKNESSNGTNGSRYYMEKEILEQKDLKRTNTSANQEIVESLVPKMKKKKIYLLGAGTSYHAAYHLHYLLLEKGINSNVILASELENYIPTMKDSLLFVYSQSGETADLIHPLKNLQKNNEIVSITNTPNSTLDRMAVKSLYLNCGREVAVASTKAFTAQLFVNFMIQSALDGKKADTELNFFEIFFTDFLNENKGTIDKIAAEFKDSRSFFFLGKAKWYPIAIEAALKLKEISYIHAEGFAGGELKHGPLSLIEDGTPVVVFGDTEIVSNATEVRTRGGIVIGINNKYNEIYDHHFFIPQLFEEIFASILMQILALKVTLMLGYNPDKPRNLAKSVTVK